MNQPKRIVNQVNFGEKVAMMTFGTYSMLKALGLLPDKYILSH